MELAGLIPTFGNVAFTLIAFVVALSIIVAVHEYGHYIVGRWSGIKADVFSIGFGPVLASKVDKHGTRWQIAALPFGGYVKFRGDADAASGKDVDAMAALAPQDRRETMHGAPLWARTATVAAGPVFNFILSLIVFAALMMVRGVATDPLTVADIRDVPGGPGGLTSGDVILAIDGEALPSTSEFASFAGALEPSPRLVYTVRRDGGVTDVEGPWLNPPIATGIVPGSAAEEAGLLKGDVITAVEGEEIFDFTQLQGAIRGSDGAEVRLDVWRDGEALVKTMTPRRQDMPLPDGGFETHYMIGMNGGMVIEPATETPGLGQAITGAANQIVFIIRSSISGLYHMIAGQISTCNLSGPVGIAETSGQAASQGWISFIWFIAVLSTAVGLLNLFPIPVLDGGHLVFYAWEAVTGRPPSDAALRYLMAGGLTLMLALMAFAVANDLFCP
ncbi:RIP metalloprotease RseP [Alphaproteobacteria bacterium GH1-50]|uniref:Zinc metalloprotease n=1 Tax=Kangsaoukella pontilimi TaxID=2691042 RepID=A0A7C9M9D9_9RHOB|nr:RIP metalloprotease RseP [Kangsaoukella pontilimi]MXQ07213.1 RIP metalloprotease RseP [Kangsaoukella pontilimi]